MTPPMAEHESQVDYVERILRHVGSIATYDALYGLTDAYGRKRSITRLASVIHTLRHQRGWVIDEASGPHELALYTVVSGPPRAPTRPVVPLWRCVACKAPPAARPEPVLGGMAQGPCPRCGKGAYFRLVAGPSQSVNAGRGAPEAA